MLTEESLTEQFPTVPHGNSDSDSDSDEGESLEEDMKSMENQIGSQTIESHMESTLESPNLIEISTENLCPSESRIEESERVRILEEKFPAAPKPLRVRKVKAEATEPEAQAEEYVEFSSAELVEICVIIEDGCTNQTRIEWELVAERHPSRDSGALTWMAQKYGIKKNKCMNIIKFYIKHRNEVLILNPPANIFIEAFKHQTSLVQVIKYLETHHNQREIWDKYQTLGISRDYAFVIDHYINVPNHFGGGNSEISIPIDFCPGEILLERVKAYLCEEYKGLNYGNPVGPGPFPRSVDYLSLTLTPGHTWEDCEFKGEDAGKGFGINHMVDFARFKQLQVVAVIFGKPFVDVYTGFVAAKGNINTVIHFYADQRADIPKFNALDNIDPLKDRISIDSRNNFEDTLENTNTMDDYSS